MADLGPEPKFLKQAAKGSRFWRRQRAYALGAAALFALGSVWQLWRAYATPSPDPMSDVFGIMAILGAAVAASVWHVHAEMMEGAALHLEHQASG